MHTCSALGLFINKISKIFVVLLDTRRFLCSSHCYCSWAEAPGGTGSCGGNSGAGGVFLLPTPDDRVPAREGWGT